MKNLKIGSFVVAIAWTATIIFAIVHNASNDRFSVTHFQGSQIAGYEAKLPYYNVQNSTSIAWDNSGGIGRTLGYLFLGLMWAATFFVATDRHLGKNTGDPVKEIKAQKSRPVLGIILIAIPLLLSIVFFFANYSSTYVSNFVSVEEQTFNQWVQDGLVEKRGENTYVDASEDNVLLHLFDNKEVIK